MKKITKLLVVGLLSMVMVFSAAACSATPTDVTGIDESLTEISTILDLLKAQQGGTNDAIAAVEAAVKAGNTKDALAAISAALTASNTAQQNAINADATYAYLKYLEAQVSKLGTVAKTKGTGYAGVHNLYPAVATIDVEVKTGAILTSNLKMNETFFPEVYLTQAATATYTNVLDAAGKEKDEKDWNLAAITTAAEYKATWNRFTEADADDTTKPYDVVATKSVVNGTGDNVGKKANRSTYMPRFIKIGEAVFLLDGTDTTLGNAVYTGKTKALRTFKQVKTFNAATATDGTDTTVTTAIVPGTRTLVNNIQTTIAHNAATMEWYVSGLLSAGAGTASNPDFVQALRLPGDGETATIWVEMAVPTEVPEDGKTVIKDVTKRVGLVADIATSGAGVTVANAELYSSGVSKAEGIYWTGTYERGWIKNIAAMEASFPALINLHPSQFAKNATGEFAFNGYITTGATLTDFHDYYVLSQLAYINALTQILANA